MNLIGFFLHLFTRHSFCGKINSDLELKFNETIINARKI
ncbi:hypothetical protein O23A_P4p0049 (plasmid) [Aeromonas salmonicida]|nr:hypothetical protein O23A_P4p0049 [Aeromonas salmonicida]